MAGKGMAMRDGDNHGKRTSRARSGFLLVVFLASFFAAASFGVAGDLKVVGGFVETVSGDYLYLRGRSYDIEGVPIEHTSGMKGTAVQIVRGSKVDLFFRGGKITTVLVYETMPE